ncbi:hypothetical protein LDENG_00003740, partial [Lucifuga dentata]
ALVSHQSHLFSWAPTYRQCHPNSCTPVLCQSRLISWALSDRQSCQSSLGSWALTSHWIRLSVSQCLLRPASSRLGRPPESFAPPGFQRLGRPSEFSVPPGFQWPGLMPLALLGFMHSGRPPESSALFGLGYLDRLPGFQRPGRPPDCAVKPDSWCTGCPLELSSLFCPVLSISLAPDHPHVYTLVR